MTRRLIWKMNQKAKRAIINLPVCEEFSHMRYFPLFIKFCIPKTKTKYPSITGQNGHWWKRFFDQSMFWIKLSSGGEFEGNATRLRVFFGVIISVFSSCGCLAPFSFIKLWSECITHIYSWCLAKRTLGPEQKWKRINLYSAQPDFWLISWIDLTMVSLKHVHDAQ